MCWTAHTACPQGPFLRLREVSSLIKFARLSGGRAGAQPWPPIPRVCICYCWAVPDPAPLPWTLPARSSLPPHCLRPRHPASVHPTRLPPAIQSCSASISNIHCAGKMLGPQCLPHLPSGSLAHPGAVLACHQQLQRNPELDFSDHPMATDPST